KTLTFDRLPGIAVSPQKTCCHASLSIAVRMMYFSSVGSEGFIGVGMEGFAEIPKYSAAMSPSVGLFGAAAPRNASMSSHRFTAIFLKTGPASLLNRSQGSAYGQ